MDGSIPFEVFLDQLFNVYSAANELFETCDRVVLGCEMKDGFLSVVPKVEVIPFVPFRLEELSDHIYIILHDAVEDGQVAVVILGVRSRSNHIHQLHFLRHAYNVLNSLSLVVLVTSRLEKVNVA